MAAVLPLTSLLGVNRSMFSKLEYLILEADLFSIVCKALKEEFRIQNENYFNLIKLNKQEENDMIEMRFIRLLIEDILSTEEYDLTGIARYTDTHEDIIDQIFTGCITSPAVIFIQRVIELHRAVRPEIYDKIIKKITEKYSSPA